MIAPAGRLQADTPREVPLTRAGLDVDAVHIWQANLDAVGAQFGQLLDERERERAVRIAREPTRRRWIAARGVLRALLGGYLDEDPSALRLAQEGHGKPVLELPGGSSLHFNLSHSGPLAVYAVTEMCAVGVDVELMSRRESAPAVTARGPDEVEPVERGRRSTRTIATRGPDEVALAERVLGSTTAERLRELDPRARRRELLRAWVRHEAEGKRLGIGVRSTRDRARMGSSQPWIAELDLGDDAVGAVALAVASVDFRVYAIDFRAYGSILPAKHNNNPKLRTERFQIAAVQAIKQRRGNAL